MTQPVILPPAPAPVLAASEQGEPTIEELAALLPEAEAVAAPVVEAAEATEVVEETVEEVAAPEPDAALERAQKAAAKAREGSRRYAATQEQLRQQAAQVQRAAREAEQLRQENAAARRLEAELKADPYKALKARGMTDADLATRAMRENTPEAAMVEIREQLEQERAARVALEQRLTSERQARELIEVEAKFAQVADDEEAYPRLSQLTTHAQLSVVKAALSQIRANGHDTSQLSDAQVAEACEIYLAPKRALKPAVAPVSTVRTVPKPSGKTLTNAMTQTRVVAPAVWDDLSEEQQLAHLAAALPDPT